MSFDEFWAEVEKLKLLPNTAIKQLPSSLSPETKKRLMKKRPEEAVKLLLATVDKINNGSVESVDTILRKML